MPYICMLTDWMQLRGGEGQGLTKKASPNKVWKIQLIFLTFGPNLQLYVTVCG